MLEPIRITSNIKPKVFENLGNGNWYYNYDIKVEEVEQDSMTEESGDLSDKYRYNYIQIKMNGKPDYKRCVESIIREYITQSQEFDLINSYNKIALKLLPAEETSKVVTEYLEYLLKLNEIKTIIRKDFQ